MKLQRIYVALLNEGTDVWRPVDAIPLGNDLFLIPKETAIPEDEEWEFRPGQEVRCRQLTFSDGINLVAYKEK